MIRTKKKIINIPYPIRSAFESLTERANFLARQAGTYFARIAPDKVYEQFDEFVQGAETERTEVQIDRGEEINVYKFFR